MSKKLLMAVALVVGGGSLVGEPARAQEIDRGYGRDRAVIVDHDRSYRRGWRPYRRYVVPRYYVYPNPYRGPAFGGPMFRGPAFGGPMFRGPAFGGPIYRPPGIYSVW